MHKDRIKRRLVAREYIKNGLDLPKALKTIQNNKERAGNGYNVMACNWRKDPKFFEDVKKELARFDKSILNDVYLLSNLYDITSSNDVKPSDRVNAMALMAKILKLTDDSNKQLNVSVFNDLMGDLKQVKPVIDTSKELTVDNNELKEPLSPENGTSTSL